MKIERTKTKRYKTENEGKQIKRNTKRTKKNVTL